MKRVSLLTYLSFFWVDVTLVRSEWNIRPSKLTGCQHRTTLGRSYAGEANTTIDGIPCQKWSDTDPHDHSFTHVGDHNFCRNPIGASQSQVWCYTTDPELQVQTCLVPFCRHLKALDFSLDNDRKPDEDNMYTHAFLKRENFPSSFTLCTAFRVDAWTECKAFCPS